MIPTLSLAYDSRGGNGLLGVGWSLSGLPKISRCGTTLAQHGFIDGVDFDDNDQFCRYDSFGNLIEMTDPAGNVTTMAYDLRGRKVAMTDPDAGTTRYLYNAFDALVWQQGAKGQEVTFIYDKLGRMIGRLESERTGVWEYDNPVISRLAKVSDSQGGYEEKIVYDEFLRPVTQKITIDG